MSLKKNKYAEYIRDITALGNPFILLLIAVVALSVSPSFSFKKKYHVSAFQGKEKD